MFVSVTKEISELFWFKITSLSDSFKVLASLFQPIRSETKTNRETRSKLALKYMYLTLESLSSLLVLSDLYLQPLASGFSHKPPAEKFPPQKRVALAAGGPYGHFTDEEFWPIGVICHVMYPLMDIFPVS